MSRPRRPSSADDPPHLPRLLARLRSLDAPLVQVWCWPGSGEQALLEALLAAEGRRARPLALADLADRLALRRAVEAAAGARWLVLPALASPAAVAAAAGRLAALLGGGVRLVFSAPVKLPPTSLACAALTPTELLLTTGESGELWRAVTGRQAGAKRLSALHRASNGWYRPLRLAAEAAEAGVEVAPEALGQLPAVASFLRHEVLAVLSPAERESLRAAAPPERPPAMLATLLAAEGEWRQASGARASTGLADVVAGYELVLLGAGAVRRRRPGRPAVEVDWPLRRAFKVLAYLATAPQMAASREELTEAIWYGEDDGAIRRNFHPTLSHLRRSLSGRGRSRDSSHSPIIFHHGVYRLNPALEWTVDVLEFERRCHEARAGAGAGDADRALAAWEAAWRLFGGPFLSGANDPWIATHRERYRRLYLEALTALGDHYAQRGRLAEAMDALRTALIEDPLQENVALELMRIYSRQGRRDLVRRQYERLSALLRTELGVEPMREVTVEYHRLMG